MVQQTSQDRYSDVDASPVKSFFVSMLTRDIKLEEAILDLLDNCVDGILRTSDKQGEKPFEGYSAEITYNAESFTISDNCGGIPWDLHEYAFRMGRSPDRPADTPGSVGVYGIGMKRAIFKIGRQCLISTRHLRDQYEVEIDPDWIADETAWRIPVRAAERASSEDGTTILIGDLHEGIADSFGESSNYFTAELKRLIATHYAYIIERGFRVSVNGDPIEPKTTSLVYNTNEYSGGSVMPFVFTGAIDGVEVYLAVGFSRGIPEESEILTEQERARRSSEDAGWTILCNGRAVLYCDRSELTGWGEAGVPRYHTQFIAISGIVDFRSDDPSKLPTTTTKRGIDASSALFLQVKNKMREGMRIFTNYTNRWKGRVDESRSHIEGVTPLPLEQLKAVTKELPLNPTPSLPGGMQYKPRLPAPQRLEPTRRRISYVKDLEAIEELAGYFDEPNMSPADVGERCFDLMYEEARP